MPGKYKGDAMKSDRMRLKKLKKKGMVLDEKIKRKIKKIK